MPPWIEREVVARYLLDVAGAWRWLSGSDSGLLRVPDSVRAISLDVHAKLARLESVLSTLPPLAREYASFERQVLGRHVLAIEPVIDTRDMSRRVRGDGVDGGHSLRAICARELQVALDKTEQSSDWTRRPLTEGQIEYAALDAEVLLSLHEHLQGLLTTEQARLSDTHITQT